MSIKVEPGICGFVSKISVEKTEDDTFVVNAKTGCQYVKAMIESLDDIDAYEEIFASFNESKVYEAASLHLKHLACPIPCAIIKLIEKEASLALPKDVSIVFED